MRNTVCLLNPFSIKSNRLQSGTRRLPPSPHLLRSKNLFPHASTIPKSTRPNSSTYSIPKTSLARPRSVIRQACQHRITCFSHSDRTLPVSLSLRLTEIEITFSRSRVYYRRYSNCNARQYCNGEGAEFTHCSYDT